MTNSTPASQAKPAQHAGAAPGVGIIDFAALPPGTKTSTIAIRAVDGTPSRGVLYARGRERTAVCFSHPRADMSQHYAVPALLEAGYAAYGHQCRGLNNDVDCELEKTLLDLAAGMTHLKGALGFEKLVLLGNSGGGSLMTFYQAQASARVSERLRDTAAGETCDLNLVEMPKADGVVLLGVHPGGGVFMLDCIDPSVVDEHDRLSLDPALDMYNPANGFREPPESSCYAPEFLSRYRAAQRARVARIDAIARDFIAEQRRHKASMDRTDFANRSVDERNYVARRAVAGNCMVVYRTEANPAYLDLSLNSWKSTRAVGSLLSPRPDRLNYTFGGFAQCVTPRAWLSNWSGISSRASVIESIKSIYEPLLMISLTADNGCFPDGNKLQVDACPSSDKSMEFVAADHYARPLSEREKCLTMITNWLVARFPGVDVNTVRPAATL
jgi:pimeloyl-ACP methyl ester carboxylesterase